MIESRLFSDEEFASRWRDAMARLDASPHEYRFVVESGHTGLPRASSIGACTRKQLFSISDEPRTDVGNPAELWAPWMGFAGQALSGAILQEMGYTLTVPDMQTSEYMTGHPDGVLTGLDLGDEVVLWDSKIRGTYGHKLLLMGEFPGVDPEMYLQMQMYMKWLGLDHCMVTVHPHDRGAFKRELRMTKKELTPVVEELTVQRLIIEANPEHQQLGEDRAQALLAARELSMQVNREHNPTDPKDMVFPCGYCEWRTRCQQVDLETPYDALMQIPALPNEWRGAE